MAQGSAKLATSCTVKGASASGVAGWSPEVSSAAVSAPSPDCAWLGWLPPEQAATTKAADRAGVESRCMGRFALQGGRASCRARGWQYVLISVGDGSYKKKKRNYKIINQ